MKHGQAGPKAGFRGVLATFQRFKLIFQQECLWVTWQKSIDLRQASKTTAWFRPCLSPLSLVTVKWPAPPFSVLKFFQLKQQVYVHGVFPCFFLFCRSGGNEWVLYLKWLCFEDNASCEYDDALFLSLSVSFDMDREWTVLVSWRACVPRSPGPLISGSDTVVSARDERK